MRYQTVLMLLVLAGCNTTPELPQPPNVVYVTVDRYVDVPEDLTRECPVYEPAEQSYNEAKRLALLRRESLLLCNKDKARIRELAGKRTGGSEKPTEGVQNPPSAP